mgnify:FL=1
MDTLSFKTISANKATVKKEWVVVDATDQVLGRMCAKVAKILRGKYKPCYTPHVDCGDNVIIINALIPFLFIYGKERGEERYCDKALRWLEELKAERNHVSEAWTRYGVQVNSALQSQALLQVKREYCDTHRCLHCKIGAEIFRRVGRG